MELSFGTTEFWRNGPQPGALYNFPGNVVTKQTSQIGASKRTL